MITVDGLSGAGSLWGTFGCPNYSPVTSYNTYSTFHMTNLDQLSPPTEFYLPKPDGVWYNVLNSVYGPRQGHIRIGTIESTNDNEFNPCLHSTIRGNAIYRGESGLNSPSWAFRTVKGTTYYDCSSGAKGFTLGTSRVYSLYGRNSSDYKGFYRDGSRGSINCSTSNAYSWYYDEHMPLNITPDSLQSLLPSGGFPFTSGCWYGHNYRTLGYPSETISSIFHRADWERPNRTTFVRTFYSEMHDSGSYCPRDSDFVSSVNTGLGFQYQGNRATSTISITHIRSLSAGVFHLKLNMREKIESKGWIPWERYSDVSDYSIDGAVVELRIMWPGLSKPQAREYPKAEVYCQQAISRAKRLYLPDVAVQARTACIQDTQGFDSNWIENASGVKEASSIIDPLISGYKAVECGDLALARKALASAYLIYKYVVSPSVSDVADVNDNGARTFALATKDRFSNERRRGMVEMTTPVLAVSARLRFTCIIHSSLKHEAFAQVWNALERFGIDPSDGQLWDLIPFSFVVDWFLPLGDTLKYFSDYQSLVTHRDIKARIEGYKACWNLEQNVLNDIFEHTLSSNGKPLEYSWYDRRIYQDIGSYDPMSVSSPTELSVSQMAQGTALITQFKK